jgi:hypothetical protein
MKGDSMFWWDDYEHGGLSIERFAQERERNMGEADASRAAERAGEARTSMLFMQADIERLLMITEEFWNILKEKHGYTDEDLIQRVQAIDMQDGRLDGRVARQTPTTCPQCGRPAARKRIACMYCGTASTEHPFAR